MSDDTLAMTHLVSVSEAGPDKACAAFRVGRRSAPFLADHGVQDMVVLPGSFYVEMARCVDHELSRAGPGRIRDVRFHRPITLGTDDVVVRVQVRDRGGGRAAYAFHEAADGADDDPRAPVATLIMDRAPAPPTAGDRPSISIDVFRRAATAIDAERFYDRLAANGNQYGPAFRRVASLWRADERVLGRLDVPRPAGAGLHPGVLDAMTQLLASFMMDRGRTFILQGIERVDVTRLDLPDTLWAHAELDRGSGEDHDRFIGSVRACDESGAEYLRLTGVGFTYLERLDGAADTAPPVRLAVAANFTAEPVEDCLTFWGAEFGVPIRTAFAPYNQVFQQLLDPASLLRTNRDGANVVLLSLEEWAGAAQAPGATLRPRRPERLPRGRNRYTLPNGLEIAHLNGYETAYLYKEIFEDQVYLRHGLRLPDDATVLDIGANIGVFSLFVMSRCRNPTIYAFEPAPAAHEALQANCDAYGANATALNVGVADRAGSATLTFYEQSSVFSGFHADAGEDREAIQAVVRNTLAGATAADADAVEEHVAILTADRLRGTTHECPMTTVSAVIREHAIDRIDLLKIDAEKSEWQILQGIAEEDWPRIAQIAMEVHDRTGDAVRRIEARLAAKGFRCAVEHERLLEDSGLYTLYATRTAAAAAVGTDAAPPARALRRNVEDLCRALREGAEEGMAPLVLCICPRTPAAEADADRAAALDAAEQRLLAEAGAVANVHAIGSRALRERYPVDDSHDPHGHQLGHVPYTARGYAAIGTGVFRALAGLRGRRFKVIVVDCDNTLWKGVCGEDGPEQLDPGGPYRALQAFLVGQMHAGMVLCLCSRNNERDVMDVFERRTDMVLKREHLVSWRVNWHRKSDNLKSLAEELDLGLDSFIFIDDNPIECTDVRIHCPAVLTLQLPSDPGSVPRFLRHVWAFDHAAATEEDGRRTRMYQENVKRRAFRERTQSLKEFLRGLDLRVEVADIAEEQFGRASQLTYRTNQFNLTTIRRSELELRNFLRRPGAAGLAVHVADRFGDYGLVGVVLYESLNDRYRVDTLLLSCRVLGRGVQHEVLSDLGRRAVGDGKRFVELTYRPTERNTPAEEFLRSLPADQVDESKASWIVPADRLAGLEYDPDDAARDAPGTGRADHPSVPGPAFGFGDADPSELLPRIAERLAGVEQIVEAVEAHRIRDEPGGAPSDVVPRGTLEAALLGIWRTVLGRPRIGLDDNFFDVGGTSLKAVQVIAMIKRDLGRDLSIVSLFECPTVARLAARLRPEAGDAVPTEPSRAAARGRRRRNARRRGVSSP